MGTDNSIAKGPSGSSSGYQADTQEYKTRVIVVGACYLDTILRFVKIRYARGFTVSFPPSVPFYPAEDEKLRASSLAHRRGGNGPNTLEVLQHLVGGYGGKPSLSLCSVLPSATSLAAEQIRQSLSPHVDLSCCIYRSDQTEAASSYIIRSLATGSRTIVNHNSLPEMTVDEFQAAAAQVTEEACWFHFEVPYQQERFTRYRRDTCVILTQLPTGQNPRHDAAVHTVSACISPERQDQCRSRESGTTWTAEACRGSGCGFLLEELGPSTTATKAPKGSHYVY